MRPCHQDLQGRIGRKPRHVEVAQDRVEIFRQRLEEGVRVIDAAQRIAVLRVGPLQRDRHQLDVVGIVFDAQQSNGGRRCCCGRGHGSGG
jgi:hypothetical protein